MDKRIGSVIIIILGIFFAKVTFESSKAIGKSTSRGPAGVAQVSAGEIAREIP
ncbi:MAG: hypothetical protein JNM93_02035 [Bacteriovoracaceae bacterium]|nr:hypothetical protein [Bacteriovoracaceae bacterium]